MITQIGGSVARKLKGEMQTAFTDENIDYTVGLQVVDPFQGYVYENEEYFPEPQAVPFETQFFPDELAAGKWKKQKKWATKRDVKDVTDSVSNLHTKCEAIEWRAGLRVTDPLQLYVHVDAEGVSREYLPNVSKIPFTTGADFNSDNWILSQLLTSKTHFLSKGSTTARNLEDRFTEVVNIRDFGAKGDYILKDGEVNQSPTDDTNALQSAINYAIENNKPLYIPSGTYYKPNNTPSLVISGSITILGDGKDVSIIKFDDDVSGVRNDMLVNTGSGYSVALENFSINGSWLDNGLATQRSQLVQLENLNNFTARYCGFRGSRFMSIVVVNSNVFQVMDCELEKGVADGIRATGAKIATVTNNKLISINDDAIAIHTLDASPGPVQSSVLVTANILIDSQGIACLGMKKGVISNNIITRPHVRAIHVGISENHLEGHTSTLAINITGNVITDLFFGKVFSPRFGGWEGAIRITSQPLIAKAGEGFPGNRKVGGGIVDPFEYFYTNDTDVRTNSGGWNVSISNNSVIRTLKPVDKYSDYGFGVRYAREGIVDPVITAPDLGAYRPYVWISDNARNLQISNNTFWGAGKNFILFDATENVGTNYATWQNVSVNNNKMGNLYSGAAISANGSGLIDVNNNEMSGDPLFVNESRNPSFDGSWLQKSPTPLCVIETRGENVRFLVKNNKIKDFYNLFNGTYLANHEWDGNILFCDPVSKGWNQGNKGIGELDGLAHHKYVITDCDTNSDTFGMVKQIQLTGAYAKPTGTVKYFDGYFLKNYNNVEEFGATGSKYILTGWIKKGAIADNNNENWIEVRSLTGN